MENCSPSCPLITGKHENVLILRYYHMKHVNIKPMFHPDPKLRLMDQAR